MMGKAMNKIRNGSKERDCKENINDQDLSNKIFEKKLIGKNKIKKSDNNLFFKIEHIQNIFVNKRDIYTDSISILHSRENTEMSLDEECLQENEFLKSYLCKRSYQESCFMDSN